MSDRQMQAIGVLKGALLGLAARQRATAANLANVDTPGYQPTHVDFGSALRAALAPSEPGAAPPLAMRASDPSHMTPAEMSLAIETDTAGTLIQRADGSGVNVDQELIIMADTDMRQNAVVELLKAQFGWLRNVITEGRR